MAERSPEISSWTASDGYPIHIASWPSDGPPTGRIVVLHGVQSHEKWYRGLGRRLAELGFEAHFPDRRGSGSNARDRGDTPGWRRLVDDVVEFVRDRRKADPAVPTSLAGISWGGKLALLAAAEAPDDVAALALICPGLQPRVGVTFAERIRIALAFFTNPTRRFPIPLSDPALFTANPEGQRFIADDPLSLRDATARLLAASTFLDRAVSRATKHVHQPALLMLAEHDRIVDNAKTRAYFDRLASPNRTIIEYPAAHHTLEFEPDPSRYAADLTRWLRG